MAACPICGSDAPLPWRAPILRDLTPATPVQVLGILAPDLGLDTVDVCSTRCVMTFAGWEGLRYYWRDQGRTPEDFRVHPAERGRAAWWWWD